MEIIHFSPDQSWVDDNPFGSGDGSGSGEGYGGGDGDGGGRGSSALIHNSCIPIRDLQTVPSFGGCEVRAGGPACPGHHPAPKNTALSYCLLCGLDRYA